MVHKRKELTAVKRGNKMDKFFGKTVFKKHIKAVSEEVIDGKNSGNMCIDDNTVVQKNKINNLEVSKKRCREE